MRKKLPVNFLADSRPGKTQDEVWVCCPFCVERGQTADTRYRLGVNLRTGQAHCFNCDWKSRGKKTFERLNLSHLEVPTGEVLQTKSRNSVRLPKDFEFLRPRFGGDESNDAAWAYLKSRKVTPKQVRSKRIGYCELGYYSGRIIFPVWDIERRLVGFVGRDWTGKQEPKYRNMSDMPRVWYNAWKLPQLSNEMPLVLVEGVLDALSVEHCGVIALAMLGKVMTQDQEEQLERFSCICILLDRDRDGILSGVSQAERLMRDHRRLYIAVPPEGKKDAGEMRTNMLSRLINSAKLYTSGYGLKLKLLAKELR